MPAENAGSKKDIATKKPIPVNLAGNDSIFLSLTA
jgi:hypothetical protein